jgi:P4 family phage/plasmid primase-like protien
VTPPIVVTDAPPLTDSTQVLEFLRLLQPTNYRELRAFWAGKPKKTDETYTYNFRADDAVGPFEFAATYAHLDLYFGVATREVRGGSGEHCLDLHALFADLDFKDSSEADVRQRLAAFPHPPFAIVSSGGGLQAYWLLKTPIAIAGDGARNIQTALRRLATALGGDLNATDAPRILRLPGTLNRKYDPPRPVELESLRPDLRYDLDTLLADLPPIEDARIAPRADALPTTIASGQRNATLFREGCRLRRLGHEEAEIFAALVAVNARRCTPPLDESELRSIARSCANYAPAIDAFPLTEQGDAEFFAALHANDGRFDHLRQRWLLFDGTIWAPQTNGEIARLATDAIRARQRAAIGQKERARWAIAGEARKRQVNLIALAQNVVPLADPGDSWDLDPWLMGTPKGVLDLKTGTLRDGRPDDRLTMRTRARFDPNAACPLWETTLTEIFENNAELIAYIQRFVGYSLTGDCREEALVLAFGDGANGKGTFINTVAYVLGDYADDLPFSAFEQDARANVPNDIAKLVGKRFVTASETSEKRQLNEARIKALTGRDPVTARFLHREFFTFQPVAKYWLSTNPKPEVRDDSEGFWRRLHLVPFNASFIGREDKTLKDRLREEIDGILAWAVRGCLAWQESGLRPPEIVLAATREYRDTSSAFGKFLEDRCVLADAAYATSGELFDAYCAWAMTEHERRMGRGEFLKTVKRRFPEDEDRSKRTQRVTFRGVGLVDRKLGGDL